MGAIGNKEESARLRWRCRRGLLELDLVFDSVLKNQYPGFSESEKRDFQRLLELGDNELLEFIQKRAVPGDPKLKQIINKII